MYITVCVSLGTMFTDLWLWYAYLNESLRFITLVGLWFMTLVGLWFMTLVGLNVSLWFMTLVGLPQCVCLLCIRLILLTTTFDEKFMNILNSQCVICISNYSHLNVSWLLDYGYTYLDYGVSLAIMRELRIVRSYVETLRNTTNSKVLRGHPEEHHQ